MNDAPTLVVPLADQQATEDAAFSYVVSQDTFADVDVGDSLNYSATLAGGEPLPGWLSFDATTRTFSGTPGSADVGVVTVRVTATDGAAATASDEFTLTVGNTNHAPLLVTPLADQVARGYQAFSYAVSADTFVDVDVGDSLSYSAALASGMLLPAWLSFDTATRTFSGTPTNLDVGSLDIRVIASDGTAAASDSFSLTIAGNTQVVGDAGDNTLFGTAGSDVINGGAGNDFLDGRLGADTLLGGAGDDVYVVDNVGDRVYETTTTKSRTDAGGNDRVESSVSWILGGFVEQLTLTGTAALSGTGNALANTIIGNAGDNLLDGKAGNDTLVGGLGDDRYVVDSLGDVVVEQSGEGTDTVDVALATKGATYVVGSHVENATVASTVAVNLTGNELANTLIGNGAANTLNGGVGDDLLDGKAGNDTLIGGLGDDRYVVDSLGDVVVEQSGEGTDTVSVALTKAKTTYLLGINLENATVTSTAAVNLTGNDLANTLVGNAAANTLNGGAGDDTLAGGAGNDSLIGGLGGDLFRFDAVLNASTNRDTISDFGVGDDRIVLLQSVFSALAERALPEEAFWASATGTAAHDADDRLVYNTSTGALYYDPDGIDGAAAVQFATLTGVPVLTAADFLVVT